MAVPLASAFVRVLPDTDKRKFRKDGEAAGKAAGEGLAEGLKRGADGKVRDAQGRFVAGFGAAGTSAGKAAGKGFGGGFLDGSSVFTKVAQVAASRIALIGLSAAAAAPGVLHLTAALAPATGALVALPAVIGAATLAMSTMRVATKGVGEAISAGLGDDPKKAEKALKEVTPAARQFVQTITTLKPQIDSLKDAVGERFFRPLQDDIEPLAKVFLPLLRKEMTGLAGPLGGFVEQLLETARKAQVVDAIRKLFASTRVSVISLRFALDPLIKALAATVGQTARVLPGLANGLVNLAVRFNNFVQQAAKSGAIFRAYQNGVKTLKDLGAIVGNVGSIFGSVFRAAQVGAGGLLVNLRDLTGQAAAFLKSSQGMATLTSIFAVLAQVGAAMRTALAGVLPQIAAAFQILGPVVGDLVGPLAQILVALAPLLPLFVGIAATVLVKLTPAIAGLATFLSQNATLVRNLAIAATALFAVYKVGSVIMAVQAAGSLALYLQKLPLVVNFTKIWTAVQAALNLVMKANPILLVVSLLAALVGGLVLAYKNSETFRRIVDAVWKGIKTAIKATVDWITGTVWPALKRVWDAIAAAAMWLWHNVIAPVWNGIKAVIGVVVNIVKGYIGLLVAEFRIIANVAMWLWHNIFSPVFSAIRKIVEIWWLAIRVVFQALWNVVRSVVGTAINFLKKLFTAVFGHIQRNVIGPWWNYIKMVFGFFRTFILGPLLTALTATKNFFVRIFNTIANAIRSWWTGTIRPVFGFVRAAWNALSAGFSSIYNSKIKPVFQAFIGFIKNQVVGGFRTGVNAIKAAWDKVKEYARKPVAFVVNSVINPFIGGLNKAAKIVGVKDQIEPIRGFASGGQIPGTPSYRDNRLARMRGTGKALAVASGEFITNTRSSLANLDLLKVINNKRGRVGRDDVDPVLDGASRGGRARRGGVGDGIGGFFDNLVNGFKGAADMILNPKKALTKIAEAALRVIPGSGFVVDFLKGAARRTISKAMDWLTGLGIGGGIGGAGVAGGYKGMQRLISNRFPGLQMISGFRPGARTLNGSRSYHALGRAVDYPPVRALAAWIRSIFGGRTKELITPFQDLNLHNGRPHRYTGAVWNQHNFAGGNAHVHWAAQLGGLISKLSGMPIKLFDNGGAWPSGTLGANMSGSTEYVSTGREGPPPGRLHPADIEALGKVIGREMTTALGANNYAAGRQVGLYSRGG